MRTPRARLQVRLPEEDLAALREMAADLRVSVSELIRRGVRRVLREGGRPSREQLIARTVGAAGIGHSGISDIAQRHDDYLADAIQDW